MRAEHPTFFAVPNIAMLEGPPRNEFAFFRREVVL